MQKRARKSCKQIALLKVTTHIWAAFLLHITSMLTSGVFVGLAEVLLRANAGAMASAEVTLALVGPTANLMTLLGIQAVVLISVYRSNAAMQT